MFKVFVHPLKKHFELFENFFIPNFKVDDVVFTLGH